jgi:hypothetical protein
MESAKITTPIMEAVNALERRKTMDIIKMVFGKMDISERRLKRKKKEKPFLLKDVIDKPENFILEALIDGEEIIVKIKRREP